METKRLDGVTAFNPLDMENLARSIANKLLETPAVKSADIGDFRGAGVYAIYYRGSFPAYAPLADEAAHDVAIYVGKAVPGGARKGIAVDVTERTKALRDRLREHAKSIGQAENLDIEDFRFRYLVVEPIWIPLGESAMIQHSQPVWNTLVEGFGNHDPGKGRRAGAKSRWDTLHQGRPWAVNFPDRHETASRIADEALEYLRSRLA
ncbi:MAG: Eco29kI family restriction endonuclease [Aeromicrobium sp.]|uniref:Eco29kI family restriction endonuclease n=1 Tax=Aeromicrobium sp. TaxID=1871063 RepID=UPI0039E4F6F5